MQGDKKPVVMTEDIDQSVAKKLHAAQHASGGSDPITPAAIGAAKDVDTMMMRQDSIDGKVITDLSAGIYRLLAENYPWKPDWCSGWGILEVKRRPGIDWGNIYLADPIYKRYAQGDVNWITGEIRWDELATTDYAFARDSKDKLARYSTNTNDGGRLTLEGAASTTLNGDISIDAYCNTVRFFESGGNTRGAMLDLSKTTNYVSSEILHTGNKPSGSYTGNGSTSRDSIDTGGIGSFAIIQSGKGIAVLTPPGGVGFKFGEGQVYYLGAYFSGGKIIISTDNELVNGNSVSYTYQVL